jgi:steroid 5-alpha reductase family enzyme
MNFLSSIAAPVAVAVAVYFFAGWLVSLARRDASVVDVLWGPGFLLAAALAAARGAGHPARVALVLALVGLWSLRLAWHIFRRNRGLGEDYRYRAMRERHGARFAGVSLVTVFLLQAALLLWISAPLLAATATGAGRPLGALDLAGAALWALGFCFEAVGDWQLARFKSDPAHRGQVMDRGLWRYTRHPNYFGDATLWWGFYLLACAVPRGAWTIASPIVMTFFLLRVSGVALLEKGLAASKPAYRDYIARTSAFVPWFPRRRG